MNRTEIANEVRDFLDLQTVGDLDAARLVRAINRAYVHTVTKVEKYAGSAFNLAATVPVLTVPSTPLREYDLYVLGDVSPLATAVRRVVGCVRVDDDGDRFSVPIVSFVLRHEWLGRPESGRSSRVSSEAVYFYRGSDGHWNLGFVYPDDKAARQYGVHYVPDVEALDGDTDIPVMVPTSWHSLIALKAAIGLIGQENRDVSSLVMEYVEGLSDMRADLEAGIPSAAVQMV